jgi:hypothetical protein
MIAICFFLTERIVLELWLSSKRPRESLGETDDFLMVSVRIMLRGLRTSLARLRRRAFRRQLCE